MKKRLPLKVPSNICLSGGADCASVAFRASLAAHRRVLLMMVLLATASGNAEVPPYLPPHIAELPPPSSALSAQQVEAQKSEILSNVPTARGGFKMGIPGFCLHIQKDDSITMYDERLPIMKEANDSRWKPSRKWSVAELKALAEDVTRDAPRIGILITSDLPLRDSKVIHDLLNALYTPRILLFYYVHARDVHPHPDTIRRGGAELSLTNKPNAGVSLPSNMPMSVNTPKKDKTKESSSQ